MKQIHSCFKYITCMSDDISIVDSLNSPYNFKNTIRWKIIPSVQWMIFDDWLKYQHNDKNWICFLLSQNSNSIQSSKALPSLLWCTLYMYVHAKFQHYQEKQLKAVQKSQEKRAKAFVAPKEDAAPPKKKQKVSGIVNCFLLLLS